MPTTIKSPLSGRVVTLCADAQSTVASGDALLIIESMKMEIPVEADRSGKFCNGRDQPIPNRSPQHVRFDLVHP